MKQFAILAMTWISLGPWILPSQAQIDEPVQMMHNGSLMAVETIDDITGFTTLLGEEPFRPTHGERTLTLKEAIAIAMEKNPDLLRAGLGVEQSLANLDLTESSYRNQYSINGQLRETLQRLKGGQFRLDPEKGLIKENIIHYENSELFSMGPTYQRTFKDASSITIQPGLEYQHDSDGAFDSSVANPAGYNYEDRYSIDVSYNYYLNSRPRLEIQQRIENAKLSAIQSDYSLFQTGKEIEDLVIGQYWQIKQLEEEVIIQSDRLLQARRIEFIIKTQFQFENASEMQVNQAEIDVMNNEATLIELEGNLRGRMEYFNQILGIPLETSIHLADQLDVQPLPKPAQEYVGMVTENNLSLKNLRLGIQKTENSMRVARLGQQPDMMFNGSYHRTDEGWENTTAALILSWPLGDGGATRARVRALVKQLEEQKIALWNAERALLRDTYGDLRNLQLLTKQIHIQEMNVEKAFQTLENAMFNFQEFGRISFRDMQDFQLDYSRSRSNLVRATVNYNLAKSSLLSKIHDYMPTENIAGLLDIIHE